ncbi:hypothetical protein CEXT_246651 [Caerostris extrusa]|uniref:Uncharacterized protein n=1 Tax=Caerostris extrusa TaxID=172846 RepID=A0AAV4NWG1_CAEEX|nr:hypothetical protein CEXT_246651 [Caerostris extrusa]
MSGATVVMIKHPFNKCSRTFQAGGKPFVETCAFVLVINEWMDGMKRGGGGEGVGGLGKSIDAGEFPDENSQLEDILKCITFASEPYGIAASDNLSMAYSSHLRKPIKTSLPLQGNRTRALMSCKEFRLVCSAKHAKRKSAHL